MAAAARYGERGENRPYSAATRVRKETAVQVLRQILHIWVGNRGKKVAEKHDNDGSTSLPGTPDFGCD